MTWLRIGLFVAALLALAGLWRHGYSSGRAAEKMDVLLREAEVTQKLEAASEANRILAVELEQQRQAKAALALELENEARNDPAAGTRRPSADSLRRLERRFGAEK